MRCKEKEDFVLANYKTMNYDEIGKRLGITRNTVQYYLTKNGIRKMERELTDEEIQFIKDNYKAMAYKELADLFGVSEKHVKGYINYQKWPKYRKFRSDYFHDIDSDIKAYFLGFIFADGWICYRPQMRNYEFGMELQSCDKYILDRLNEELGGVHKIVHNEPSVMNIKGHLAHHNHSDILRVYSKQLIEDLMSHGIDENKSQKDTHPIVQGNLFFDFLRGYIDGDGCYYCDRNKGCLTMHITCASAVPLEWIRDTLKQYGIYSYVYCEHERKYRLFCSRQKDLSALLSLLYHDNFSLCLSRKYNKIKSFLDGSAV